MSMGRPLSRRAARPRFKNGNFVRSHVELLLKEQGVTYDPEDLEIESTNKGNTHGILLRGELIGDYNHIHCKLRLYAEDE